MVLVFAISECEKKLAFIDSLIRYGFRRETIVLNFADANDIEKLDIREVVERIITLNEGLTAFWGNAKGWAPIEAAELLNRSRLDWQVSLSRSLNRWISEPIKSDDYGSQILAWVNLGSLVEGTLKLFLSVWYKDYVVDLDAFIKRDKIVEPDVLELELLRQFFTKKNIWNKEWDEWVLDVQKKRNAVHAYKHRDLGNYNDFLRCIRKYLELLRFINGRLPYPDFVYEPKEQGKMKIRFVQ